MFTIIGASGFLGSHLAGSLRASGAEVHAPERGDDRHLARDLGHVLYCAGVTSDFLARPLDTVEAHVAALLPILRRGRFHSLLYLSSTRLYSGAETGAEEASLRARPARGDDLYNLTKMTGEAICLACGRAGVRAARLSNVYGAGMPRINFLAAVVTEAVQKGRVALQTTLDSSKDYMALDDVVALLPRIASEGRRQLYNVAAGRNVRNAEIMDHLARLTGCKVAVLPNAAKTVFPQIDIGRIRDEFGFVPATLESRLPQLVAACPSFR